MFSCSLCNEQTDSGAVRGDVMEACSSCNLNQRHLKGREWATTSVDPENEAELQKAIDALTHNKTIIMIAHRLKTVRNADQILVLNGGKITQRGTHEELAAQSGLYADFIHAREEAAGWKLA